MRILCLDPSGTSLTGYFLYENWSKGEIGSLEGKNYLIQAKNLENLIKNHSIQVLIGETSFGWKSQKAQKDLQELVYLNGVLGWLAEQQGCESKQVLNHSIKEVSKQTIAGLKKLESGGQFKGQPINQHERDALLVFGIYGTRMIKREGPFSD